jgi:hypothetical protein
MALSPQPQLQRPASNKLPSEEMKSPPRVHIAYGQAVTTPDRKRADNKASSKAGKQVFLGWAAAKAAAETENDGIVPPGQRILVPVIEEPIIKVEDDVDYELSSNLSRSGEEHIDNKAAVAKPRSDHHQQQQQSSSSLGTRARSGNMLDVPGVTRPVTPNRKRKVRGSAGSSGSDKENNSARMDNGEDMVALPGAGRVGRTPKRARAEARSLMSPTMLAGYGVKPVDSSNIVGWGATGAEGTSGKSWEKVRSPRKSGNAWTLRASSGDSL